MAGGGGGGGGGVCVCVVGGGWWQTFSLCFLRVGICPFLNICRGGMSPHYMTGGQMSSHAIFRQGANVREGLCPTIR